MLSPDCVPHSNLLSLTLICLICQSFVHAEVTSLQFLYNTKQHTYCTYWELAKGCEIKITYEDNVRVSIACIALEHLLVSSECEGKIEGKVCRLILSWSCLVVLEFGLIIFDMVLPRKIFHQAFNTQRFVDSVSFCFKKFDWRKL